MPKKKITRKNISIPKHKIPPLKRELPLYKYVEERAKVVAKEIFQVLDAAEHDEGGIIFIEGPLHSGKTLVAIELAKHQRKNYKMVFAQPDVDRPDVVKGYFYSKKGVKFPVQSFKTRKDLIQLLDQAEVIVIEDVM